MQLTDMKAEEEEDNMEDIMERLQEITVGKKNDSQCDLKWCKIMTDGTRAANVTQNGDALLRTC